ncbi:hypothetical protein MSKU9_2675 [Komagataeibacter diospyri]|uniref:Uncharacterized protein n=1 Tax=Komagataeibacter diospyri TaxID=1932662 RepID=A0A4P5NW66_9PROT|nr:hypothetical protein MSKU9_2675 [Komagataeibacter diospyri]
MPEGSVPSPVLSPTPAYAPARRSPPLYAYVRSRWLRVSWTLF